MVLLHYLEDRNLSGMLSQTASNDATKLPPKSKHASRTCEETGSKLNAKRPKLQGVF